VEEARRYVLFALTMPTGARPTWQGLSGGTRKIVRRMRATGWRAATGRVGDNVPPAPAARYRIRL